MFTSEIKEVFEYRGKKLLIAEAKEYLLNYYKVEESSVKDIDTRILTCIGKYNKGEVTSKDFEIGTVDYIIYVYNYEEMKKDTKINEAIILHELGHIHNPPGTIQQEIACDIFALKECGAEAMYNVLELAIEGMGKMGKSTKDLEIRKITVEAFLKKKRLNRLKEIKEGD